MSRYEPLLHVRLYDFAHWRYAIGHPRAGELSRVEMYERIGASVDYVREIATNRVVRFG